MRSTLTLALFATIGVSAHAQLTLPFSGTDATATLSSFQIIKSGADGRANSLYISNASNTSDVLLVNTVGLGRAAYFSITNAANSDIAIRADSNGSGIGVFGFMTGTGRAGSFRIINGANTNAALHAQTNGSGPALFAQASIGPAGFFQGDVQSTGEFLGDGSGLTNLNASNIISGTLDTARLTVPLSLTGSVIFNGIITGTNSDTSGRGVFGLANAASGFNYGVWGQSVSTGGTGVFGWASAASGTTNGGRFLSDSTSGRGVIGVATATSGNTFGGRFENVSTSGRGVYGLASAVSGFTYGGYFQSNSTSGRAVEGFASATSGFTYAVVGQSNSLTTGYGVFSFGRTGASGTKSFRIDHPFDPENKYLNHYCAEGPEPLNVYTGNVKTDANGEAWVQLPDYFGEINKDFRYTLTVVDDTDSDQFVMAKVAREIRENKFKIRTSQPRVKVTWRVEAVRNDLWVRKNGAPVETDKPEQERGKYQHPELYGKPKEMGMNYRAEQVSSEGPASRPRQ